MFGSIRCIEATWNAQFEPFQSFRVLFENRFAIEPSRLREMTSAMHHDQQCITTNKNIDHQTARFGVLFAKKL